MAPFINLAACTPETDRSSHKTRLKPDLRMPKRKPTTVSEYINAAPKHARKMLREIRSVLKKVAPKATEKLKWGSPVLEERRILFAFNAFKSHVSFVPTHLAMVPFQKDLAEYTTRKDSVQFRYDKPLPKALIRRIAAYRLKQVRKADARWRY